MVGFLLKLLIIAAVISGIGGYIYIKKGSLPDLSAYTHPQTVISEFRKTPLTEWGNRLSIALDSLVTHPDRNSPVVLGTKIASDSLNAVVDTIQKMPPDQIKELQQFICAPATSSAK
jgi:hypothetical protein